VSSSGLSDRPRRVSSTAYRAFSRALTTIRRRFFPQRRRRPLYESTVLDDLLFAQPVNLCCRWARRRSHRRSLRAGGVSVIIVNFNTIDLTRVVLGAVRRLSPPDTEIIVVDNASSDGSRAWLKERPHGCVPIGLPTNVGHGRALDIGVYASTSPVFITLDSDAFPYAPDWVERLTDALSPRDVKAAGCWGPRDRLHPACAAFERDAFLATGQSFANFNLHLDLDERPVFGVNTWDTGELVFEALGREAVSLLPVEPTEFGGVSMAGFVYHHTAMTTRRVNQPDDPEHRPASEWERAVAGLLDA